MCPERYQPVRTACLGQTLFQVLARHAHIVIHFLRKHCVVHVGEVPKRQEKSQVHQLADINRRRMGVRLWLLPGGRKVHDCHVCPDACMIPKDVTKHLFL